jgi:hypothetical protein
VEETSGLQCRTICRCERAKLLLTVVIIPARSNAAHCRCVAASRPHAWGPTGPLQGAWQAASQTQGELKAYEQRAWQNGLPQGTPDNC